MLRTLSASGLKGKLKGMEFDEKFRFRECREDSLVKCASCIHAKGDIRGAFNTIAQCTNPLRFRRVRIACEGWGSGSNGSQNMVCDAYQNKPLPDNVSELVLKEGEGVVLQTQFADCIHVDSKCPYVVEETRLERDGGKTEKYKRSGEVRRVDISEIVPGEESTDMCDMPCCESRLQFQIIDPNTYRNRVGIHPNVNDRPIRFVRNAITRHGKNSDMTYEEAEAFFDLTKVVGGVADRGRHTIHEKIAVVADYIYKRVNGLGSRSLTEATNPVWLNYSFEVLAIPVWLKDMIRWKVQDSADTGADVWMYDKRLFDGKKGLERPLVQLERIPEGIIPCVDSRDVLKNVRRAPECNRLDERFNLYGILKPVENRLFSDRGVTHFLDIRHVSYRAHEHWWGESGAGFSGVASFHEQ